MLDIFHILMNFIIALIVLDWMNSHFRAIRNKQNKLNVKLTNIMATLAQLSQKVDELQTALDAEQDQIKEAIAALEAIVLTLTEEVAAGGTEAERQAVADKIDSVIADLKSTVVDESTTTSTTETTTVAEVPGE